MKAAASPDVILGMLGGDRLCAEAAGRAELHITLAALAEIGRAAEAAAGRAAARRAVSELAFAVRFLPEPAGERLLTALNRDMDLQDSILASAAEAAGMDVIITKRPAAFRGCAVKAVTPEEFIKK